MNSDVGARMICERLKELLPRRKFSIKEWENTFSITTITCEGTGVTIVVHYGGRLDIQFGVLPGVSHTWATKPYVIRRNQWTPGAAHIVRDFLQIDTDYKRKVYHQRQEMRKHIEALKCTEMFEDKQVDFEVCHELYDPQTPHVVATFRNLPNQPIFRLFYPHYEFAECLCALNQPLYEPDGVTYPVEMGGTSVVHSDIREVMNYLNGPDLCIGLDKRKALRHLAVTNQIADDKGRVRVTLLEENLFEVAPYLLYAAADDFTQIEVHAPRRPILPTEILNLGIGASVVHLFPETGDDNKNVIICLLHKSLMWKPVTKQGD